MADSKISALPASTTPLAGTEVLPIVQSSATKQVTVANLTAGRAVATGALTVTGDATLSTGNIVIGTSGKGVTTGSAISLGLGTNGSTTQAVLDTSGNLSTTGTLSTTDQRRVVRSAVNLWLDEGISRVTGITSGTATTIVTANIPANCNGGRIVFQAFASNVDGNSGYAAACSVREILYSKFGGTTTILKSTELSNNFGSINAGVISVVVVTSATVSGATILLQAAPTATGSVGSISMTVQGWTQVFSSGAESTLTLP